MPAHSKFRPEFIEQSRKLAEMGHTDAEIADFFGISVRVFHRWKAGNPELSACLKVGKVQADENVKRSLYQRARGFVIPETIVHFEKRTYKNGRTKIVPHTVEVEKHFPPDATSCIFWLKNREPELWREKFEHDHGLNLSREKLAKLLATVESRIAELEVDAPGDAGVGRLS